MTYIYIYYQRSPLKRYMDEGYFIPLFTVTRCYMILFVDAPLPVETHAYFHSVYRMLDHLLIVIL